MRWLRTVLPMLAALGCASGQQAVLRIGTPCPALAAARDTAPQRLFIEVSDLTHFDDDDRAALLKHQQVAVQHASVASGVFTDQQRSHVPWTCPRAQACAANESAGAPDCQISLTPSLPQQPGESVRLGDIRLHGTAQQPNGRGPDIELRDQETRVVELVAESGCRISLAITPYVMQSDEDLATLLACKRAARTQ